jgi:hypothetical protein
VGTAGTAGTCAVEGGTAGGSRSNGSRWAASGAHIGHSHRPAVATGTADPLRTVERQRSSITGANWEVGAWRAVR